MGRISNKVLGYKSKDKGNCKTAIEAFDKIEQCRDTLFSISREKKKSWGTAWYDYSRHNMFEAAIKEIILQPEDFVKNVAITCLNDIARLWAELRELEVKGGAK